MKRVGNSKDRCEPWCRHYYKTGGETVCGFGGDRSATEKGAQCLGRREIITQRDRDETEEERRKRIEAWRKSRDDTRCRSDCIHFTNDICAFGPVRTWTEDGAQCIGEKTTGRKKGKT